MTGHNETCVTGCLHCPGVPLVDPPDDRFLLTFINYYPPTLTCTVLVLESAPNGAKRVTFAR